MDNTLSIIILIFSIVSLATTVSLLLFTILQNKRISSKTLEAYSGLLSEHERRMYAKLNDIRAETARDFEQLRTSLGDSLSARLEFMGRSLGEKSDSMNQTITANHETLERHLLDRQETLRASVGENLANVQSTLNANNLHSEERFKSFESALGEQLRSLETSLRLLRETTSTQLDAIRGVVNEKLQQTLNERLSESFKIVDDRLAEVYKGLGEMQTLATGVGDLKKVLSNVKTRGILGEIQLKAILDEILAPEQFVSNFAPEKGKREVVEFAVKLPNTGGSAPVYLPIDSKFPGDRYIALMDAYDIGDQVVIAEAKNSLKDTLISCAKDINKKYIKPPITTNFAIMFLPTEGLYAEAVRMGMIEELQTRHSVNLAGPSTMAALLNSLQMGFRTLAIQKQSSDVWDLLADVKKEFGAFNTVLTRARSAIENANTELDALIGTRTRKILNTISKIESLPSPNDAAKLTDGAVLDSTKIIEE